MSIFTELLEMVGLVKTATPSPLTLPIAWLGVDRKDIPGAGRGDSVDDPVAWLGLLIDNSNLRFCGAYLAQKAPPPPAGLKYTNSSQDEARKWVPNVTAIRKAGWGTAFWYVGYSIGGNQDVQIAKSGVATADYPALGTLHAQHAKTIVASFSPVLDGAVVYFDNEDYDTPEHPVDATPLAPYYDAFFDELQKQGPGALPALRPGLYTHRSIAPTFLAKYPYLFYFSVSHDERRAAPFDAKASPLVVAAKNLTLTSVLAAAQMPRLFPVGRQFRITYPGPMPAGEPLSIKPGLTPVNDWDYDCAAVRDPTYPNAEPRLGFAVGPTIFEGRFSPRGADPAADPPQMLVDLIQSDAHSNIALLPGEAIEPDAPLVTATFPGSDQGECATALSSGDIAVCNSQTRTWLNTGSVGTTSLRRLRAMAYAAFAADDLQLFFIGVDHSLYGIRSAGGGPWSVPARMGAPLVVHPFGMLAATSRAGSSVDVFTINDAGLLATATWTPPGAWPGSASQTLEATGAPGAFLSTTSIAAVSAAPNSLHVFGVGTDLRLRYMEFDGTTWNTPKVLGGPSDFVSPHTRLAAHAPTSTRVEVTAVSDAAKVRIYVLASNDGQTWAEVTPRVEFQNPSPVAPAGYSPPGPGALIEIAYGWRINPFGDLAIGVVDGNTAVFAAGIASDETALLRRSTAAGSAWIRFL